MNDGTVQSVDGEPIPNAVVGNGTFAALTDAVGDYYLTIPTGATTLNALAAQYIPATESLSANMTSADTSYLSTCFTLTPVGSDVTSIHGSFESEADLWEGSHATVALSTEHVTDGEHSMHVTFLENVPEEVLSMPLSLTCITPPLGQPP